MNLTTAKEIPMYIDHINNLFRHSESLECAYGELAETNERIRRNLREIREISLNTQTEKEVTRLKDLEKYVYNDAKDILYFGEEIKKNTKRIHGIIDE